MNNLHQHLFLIVLFHFLITGCGSYSSNEDKMDGGFHPVVSSISPGNGIYSVSIDSSISVTFSEEMNTSSVTTNTSDTTCSGSLQISSDNFTTCVQISSSPTVSNSNKTYSVTPSSSLSNGTDYKVRLTTGIKDVSGTNLFEQYSTSTGFTTEISVTSTSPEDSDTSVSVSTTISVTFSEAMDTSSVTTNTSDTTCSGSLQISSDNFTTCVQMSSSPVASNSNKTFTVTPSSYLSTTTIYKIRISTVVKTSSGNGLSSKYGTSNGFTIETINAVAVGEETILVSPDNGSTWKSISSVSKFANEDITYGNSKFVATGWFGRIITSSDGITWTEQTIGSQGNLNSITYGGDMFVVVGSHLVTSTDGITWTERTLLHHYSVTYGDSTFVAGGYRHKVDTSTDGITWTSGGNFGYTINRSITGIAFGNGTFVAVTNGGTIKISSNNGTTWTSISSGLPISLSDISFGNNTFVTVSGSGTILTSSDNGITWTSRTSGTTNGLTSVAFGNNTFLAVGSDILKSSDNGTTWDNVTSITPTPYLKAVTFSE